jgi:hypothetical protein
MSLCAVRLFFFDFVKGKFLSLPVLNPDHSSSYFIISLYSDSALQICDSFCFFGSNYLSFLSCPYLEAGTAVVVPSPIASMTSFDA